MRRRRGHRHAAGPDHHQPRVALRWKPTDDGPRPKARWCVHGLNIHEMEQLCPTPPLATLHLAMQAIVGDATTALMQGDPSNRKGPLYVEAPGGDFEPLGLAEGSLVRLGREAYGS